MKKILSSVIAIVMAAGLLPGIAPTVSAASNVTVVIPASAGYEFIDFASEGLAMVKKDGKCGFVDIATGAVSIPLIYDEAEGFSEGLAAVRGASGKWGFIDKTGEVKIPFEYDAVDWKSAWRDRRGFSDGLVAVGKGVYPNIMYGCIDKTGAAIVPLQYSKISPFCDGMAAVCDFNNKWGFIDKNGDEIIAPQYDMVSDFSDGMSLVRIGDFPNVKHGFVDKTGDVVIPVEYDTAFDFGNGLAPVGIGSLSDMVFGYIDKNNNMVIPMQFEKAGSFYDGLAPVLKDGKPGLIDTSGTVVVPLDQYDDVSYDWIRDPPGMWEVHKDDKAGLIDKTGKLIIAPEYADLLWGGEEYELGIVYDDNYHGVFDKSGVVVPPDENFDVWLAGKGYAVTCNFYTKYCTLLKIGDPHDDRHCIDYSADDLIVPSKEKPDEIYINLTKETITIPASYTSMAFSIDNGAKWKPVKDALGAAKFPKLFSKDITLRLSDKPIDKTTKKPPVDAEIITFPKINKRAALIKLVINYETAADKTGATPGGWVLTEKGGSAAVKDKIEVGVAGSTKKKVNEKGWGRFYGGKANGICVKPLTGEKVKKTVYFYRTEPSKNGDVYTAASKPKKISATSERKIPKYAVKSKPAKKNAPATAIIKVKANTYVSINGETPKLYTVKTNLNVLNVTGKIELWQSAIVKKTASAKRTIYR